jgi:hypothetical protein
VQYAIVSYADGMDLPPTQNSMIQPFTQWVSKLVVCEEPQLVVCERSNGC